MACFFLLVARLLIDTKQKTFPFPIEAWKWILLVTFHISAFVPQCHVEETGPLDSSSRIFYRTLLEASLNPRRVFPVFLLVTDLNSMEAFEWIQQCEAGRGRILKRSAEDVKSIMRSVCNDRDIRYWWLVQRRRTFIRLYGFAYSGASELKLTLKRCLSFHFFLLTLRVLYDSIAILFGALHNVSILHQQMVPSFWI